MKFMAGWVVVVFGIAAQFAHAQPGMSWSYIPDIVVVSAAGDPSLHLVDEAVVFWNKTLEEINSGFRLGIVSHVVQPIPEMALQAFSESVVGGRGGLAYIPPPLRDLPGALTVFLAESEFVSFAGPFDTQARRVAGIRGAAFPPMTFPNVARNVIAHELGHAIGLGHNGDPSTLMCGRPAPCRPALFRSDKSSLFPVTAFEKRQLLWMYPPEWNPKSR